jgi:sugar phosphate isomerase/epimerase
MTENKLGLCNRFFREPSVEKWRTAAAAGFTEAELQIRHEMPSEKYHEALEETCRLFEDGGLHVSSLHLPFGPRIDISRINRDSDPAGASDPLEDLKMLLAWAGDKKIPIAVIHPSFEPIEDGERPARLLKAAENIKLLGAYAKTKGVTLAVENLPRTCLGNCAAEMLTLTDHGRNASMCFDVNHLLLESHRDFYSKVAPHVVTTHFSDYDRINERHWFVGDGCIDWIELAGLFKSAGYKGRFIFELDEVSSPKAGRPVTPAELMERFKTITGSLY